MDDAVDNLGLPSRVKRRGEFVVLIAVCALVWGWTYGMWDLWDADEGRYVQIAKELVGRKDWLLLTVQGEPYLHKQPLPFWILAGMLKITGGEPSPWAVRLPSVLFATLTVLMTYWIGRRLFGARAGLIAGFVLLSAPLFAKQAPMAGLDMQFAGWTTAALVLWLVRERSAPLSWPRATLFWLCLTGAFFTKGPLALIIVLAPVIAEACWSRSWAVWRSVRPMFGLTVLALLIIGWLWSQQRLVDANLVRGELVSELSKRFVDADHAEPIWFYAGSLFSGVFMPWTLFLAAALFILWKRRRGKSLGELRPILLWAFIPLLALHLAVGKRAQYLLPLLPPIALLVGWYTDRKFLTRGIRPWIGQTVAVLAMLVAVAALTIAYLAYEKPEMFAVLEFHIRRPQAVIAAVAALAILATARFLWNKPDALQLVIALIMMMVTGEIVMFAAINPALNQRKSSVLFARTIEALLPEDQMIVGAIDKAAKPQYHVAGSYTVKPIHLDREPREDSDMTPPILVARRLRQDPMADASELTDYEWIGNVEASGDPLMVFRRSIVTELNLTTSAPTPLYFALMGDTGEPSVHLNRIIQQVSGLNKNHPLSAIFLLGDNLYGNEPFSVALQKRFMDPFWPLLRQNIPFHATLGNHDDNYPDRWEGELETPLFNMRGKEYHAKTFGDDAVTFIVLCSKTIAHDPNQIDWFRTELTRCRSDWKILILHKPMIASDAEHGPSKSLYKLLKDIMREPNDIDVVFTGHNHFYERRQPLDGILHITIGASSKSTSETLPPDPGRVVGYTESRSFGWIRIDGNMLHLQAFNELGEVIDDVQFRDLEDPDGIHVTELR